MTDNKPMSADDIRAAVLESLKATGVTMNATHAGLRRRDEGDGKTWEHDAWFITFTKTGVRESVSFDYCTGIGHRKVPKSVRRPYYIKDQRGIAQWTKENARAVTPQPADVLHCLLLDAEANDMSFNDWADNFGYDTDSRKALEIYTACCDSAKKLHQLFTRSEQDALRELLQDF